ncbi:Chromatin remodeling factor m.t1.c1 [Apiospora rasikravindrae]|uniref:Chromatin remodeling factor m.t1.c1 n=1 Tax=Apiospora rasikravindrae TaxID=990691 RepID=A0ABR1TEU8_9PEZI
MTTANSFGDSEMGDVLFDLSEVGAAEPDAMDIDGTATRDQDILGDVNTGLQSPADDSIVVLGSSPKDRGNTVPNFENDEPVTNVQPDSEEAEKKRAVDHAQDSEDPEDLEELQDFVNQAQEGTPSRLLPIEVVLSPVEDPDSYRILPPSWTVEKVTREVEQDGEVWYEVEFDDGRVDMVAYDDLYELEHGSHSLNKFQQDQRLASEQRAMASRAAMERSFLEDDYSDSDGSGSDQPRKKRLRTRAPVRRSQRQTTSSRQASVDHRVHSGHDEHSNEDSDGAAFDDDDNEPSTFRTRGSRAAAITNKRVTRASNSTKSKISTAYAQANSSEDELANDSDGDTTFRPVVSDLAPTKRASARKKKSVARYTQSQRRNDRDSSIEFETNTRRSGRSAAKNYAVPDVDDDYVIYEDKTDTAAPKHVSVKEIFKPLVSDSDFAKMHSQECSVCQGKANSGKGSLVYCQGCSYSFHKICLGVRSQRDHRVTKVGHDDFVLQCRICIGLYRKKDGNAPDHAKCQTCKLDNPSCFEFSTKKTPKQEEKLREENEGQDPITPVDPKLLNNAELLLFRCSSCKRGIHFDHLPPLTKDGEIASDIRADRLEEYAMVDWKCKDCVDSDNKIHALVAWRPVDESSYIKGQTCFDLTEDAKEYLVKWDGRSHFHDTWMPGAWVFGVAASAMRSAFAKRNASLLPKMTTKDAIEEEWLLADVLLRVNYHKRTNNSHKAKDLARLSDIKDVYVKFQGLSYTEAVWDTPPPKDSGAPWEAFCAAYEEFIEGAYFRTIPEHKMRERIQQYRSLDFAKECELKGIQPPGLKRGKLMEYQMEGVNWLLFNFHQKHNVILADEMGLGKTVQVVAFISSLVEDKPNCWPFLIVVPNSTCPNWRRELKQWAPSLRVVTYHGGKDAQQLAYTYELFPDGVKEGMKAHVVILSYEAAVEARTTFRSVNWAGLIVDEGQRLKNDESQLYLALQSMKIPFRLLLTGTPLQNNKRELFNLLQFIDPAHNAEELDVKYAELTKENIPELHQMIRPYFLRRTKLQVLKFLPSMAQVILPVTMSVLQEKLSRSIMSRNPQLIKAIISRSKVKAGERKSLNNILMELRRCLCHPFIFSDDVEDWTVTDPARIQANMVEASGKLLLLNVMLPKLKERGHRVLIFSQFLMSLTIIEDFMTGLGLAHARIDGSLSALEKQKRIDAFNAPDSPLFAMLLSTRAGGVGINLASADTVIIYDPDFNPHQDIQALSRAHRIGQKNKVLCFQLMTKNTVEEKIMQIGRKKMALDHALIESMDAGEDAGDDLESILKHGAQALFADEAQDKIVYDDASVEKLLDRTQIETTNAGSDESAESQFSFARVWANDKGDLNANTEEHVADDDTPAAGSVWENILKQREAEHQAELAATQQTYGRGARRRVNKVYNTNIVSDFIEGVNDDLLMEQQPQANDSGSEMEVDDELYIDRKIEESDDEYERIDGADFTATQTKGSKGTKRSAAAPTTITPIPAKKAKTDVNTPQSTNDTSAGATATGSSSTTTTATRGKPGRKPPPSNHRRKPTQKKGPAEKTPTSGGQDESKQVHPEPTDTAPEQTTTIDSTTTTAKTTDDATATGDDAAAVAANDHDKPPSPGPDVEPTANIQPGGGSSVAQFSGATTGGAQRVMQAQAWENMPNHHNMPPRPSAKGVPVLTSNAAPQQGAQKASTNVYTGHSQSPGSSACVLCGKHHKSGKPECFNMNQEMDLRIALDELRRSKAQPADVQATKSYLTTRLKELQTRKQQ